MNRPSTSVRTTIREAGDAHGRAGQRPKGGRVHDAAGDWDAVILVRGRRLGTNEDDQNERGDETWHTVRGSPREARA